MDQQKLRNLVFEKTGIKVDVGDPIFALVALNEAVLAESVGIHLTAMHEATELLGVRTRQLQDIANQIRQIHTGQASASVNVDDWESEAATAIPAPTILATQSPLPTRQPPLAQWGGWQAVAIIAAISLFSAGAALIGQALMAPKSGAVLAAPLEAKSKPELSAEQLSLIRNGEAFAKLMPKLDEKTRARIMAELSKQ